MKKSEIIKTIQEIIDKARSDINSRKIGREGKLYIEGQINGFELSMKMIKKIEN